jgi:predicted MPP superfamily phosphohydrolase
LLLREHELTLPGWAPEHQGLRIAVLTDLHVGSPHHGITRLKRIVRTVNDARPDLVVILGDLVIQGVMGGRFVPPESTSAELAHLRAPFGVFGVLGNHDWWLDAPRVANALRAARIVMLEDTAASLAVRGRRLAIAGVSDLWEGKHDINTAIRSVPANEAIILITHNPDIFPDVPGRVSLTIAGHTHGGQVNLPLLGRLVVPSRYGQRYAAGHIVEAGKHLFVSTGLGTSILPIRFRVPPEIVVLRVNGPL